MTNRIANIKGTYVHRLFSICSSACEHKFIGKRTFVLRNMLLLLMVMGVNGMWGQTGEDYSGIFYFVNCGSGKTGDPTIANITNADNYFYLVPADNPQQENKRDAWFSSDYSTANGDPEKPYLTTVRTKKDAAEVPEGVTNRPHNSVWIVKFASTDSGTDYYYLIHAATGKYVVYEPPYSTKNNRKSMHLLTTDSPGENAKFAITIHSNNYNFRPKSIGTGASTNKYLNAAQQNYTAYYSSDAYVDGDADYFRGLVGLWKDSGDGSDWMKEETLLPAPTINYNSEANTFTITYDQLPEGYDILYTTDDSDPTLGGNSTKKYSSAIPVEGNNTIKAAVVRYDMILTEIASAKLVLNPTVTLAENEYTYDGSAKEPAVSSVKDGETVISSDEYIIEYQDNVSAGSATVLIKNNTGGNYIVYGSATFTINPKALTITADALSKAYGDDDPVLTYTSQGLVGSDAITGELSREAGENVGTYAISQNTLTASNNYSISYTGANLTITPKALTVTAKPKTITYGDEPANDGVTYSAFAPSEDESVLSGTLAYAYNYAQYGNAGNYTITPCGLTGANYDITFVAGTLTVAQKEVALTWSEMTTFPYDGSAHVPTATVTGMLNSDAIAVTVTGAQTNAGDYTATALELTGTKSDNYKLPANHTREFSITRIGLTVTANNNAITYGDAPVGNGVTYEGFVNNETASVLGGTLDYAYSYTQFGDVGNTYTITPKGLTSNNYDISFVAGILTVGQKEVGITWGETTSFVYDGSAHAPTAGATGLVNDDAVTVFVTGAQANVGEYIATASSLIGNKAGNYKILGVNEQSFTISPKSIGDGTLADGYTLDFGEGNAILLTDDVIGRALVDPTDYSVGEDTNPSAQYFERTVTATGNYTGSFNVRNVFIAFTTDTNQEEWSATFIAEKADESDIGLALPEGVSAFIISGIQGEWAIPEPLNYIPEGIPVLLVARKQINGFVAKKVQSGEVTPITPDQKARNMLEEVSADTPGYNADTESAPFATKQIYVLYKNEFYFNKAGSMKKGKVYLNPNHNASSLGSAPVRLQIAWNNTTDIQNVQDGNRVKMQDDIWYTIDGRHLSGKPNTKGLYIVGGKKIVVK